MLKAQATKHNSSSTIFVTRKRNQILYERLIWVTVTSGTLARKTTMVSSQTYTCNILCRELRYTQCTVFSVIINTHRRNILNVHKYRKTRLMFVQIMFAQGSLKILPLVESYLHAEKNQIWGQPKEKGPQMRHRLRKHLKIQNFERWKIIITIINRICSKKKKQILK